MMTEMIDRVAKAIDAAIDRYFAEWKAKVEPDGVPWIGVRDIPREVFARAAIEEYEKALAEKNERHVVYTKDGVAYFSDGLAQQDEPVTYVKHGIAACNSPLRR